MKPIFTIVFEDGSGFKGGTEYTNTGWLKIPNKKIKRIFYKLSDDNHLCLKGYSNFYHIVEATVDLNGKNKGKTRIEKAYILGLKNKIVTSYRITLFCKKDGRYRIGDIVRREFDINSEFIKGLNFNGWKPRLK